MPGETALAPAAPVSVVDYPRFAETMILARVAVANQATLVAARVTDGPAFLLDRALRPPFLVIHPMTAAVADVLPGYTHVMAAAARLAGMATAFAALAFAAAVALGLGRSAMTLAMAAAAAAFVGDRGRRQPQGGDAGE